MLHTNAMPNPKKPAEKPVPARPAAKKKDPNAPSAVEGIKERSRYLLQPIKDELGNGLDHFSEDAVQVLKFHGSYQQDDRDLRMAMRQRGEKGKAYSMMIRNKIPGGRMTSKQMLAELDLADELGDTTIRLTTRQSIQFHHIPKKDLRALIKRINEIKLSTLGACGDINRNVMCCPAPIDDEPHRAMRTLTDELAVALAPRTSAYYELWLTDETTGEKELVGGDIDKPAEIVEPLYGKYYMPRKFKVGVGLPEDNCIDIYTQDLGFLCVHEHGKVLGYNVIVGGGFGVTPANKKTHPALGKKLCFCTPEQAVDVAKAVVKTQRDHGDRSDRKVARLKYTLERLGVERFKTFVEEHFGGPLPDPHPADVHGFDDHIGWQEQGDGKWLFGLNVENGRIKNEGSFRLKSAIRQVCREMKPPLAITTHQSLLFCDIAEADKEKLEQVFKDHGVPLPGDISEVRRFSMACVAWPTCGLAITEAERALPGIITELEGELAKHGISEERFTVRMTGCPNGCARPYNADVGIVGKGKDKYTLFLGGRLLGDRLSFIYKDLVPREDLVPSLSPLLGYFRAERTAGETFGDFCARKGKEELLAYAESGP